MRCNKRKNNIRFCLNGSLKLENFFSVMNENEVGTTQQINTKLMVFLWREQRINKRTKDEMWLDYNFIPFLLLVVIFSMRPGMCDSIYTPTKKEKKNLFELNA